MGCSYSGNPATSNRDAVRFYVGDTGASVGDTDCANYKLTNEEIDYLLTQYPSVFSAAAAAARQIGQEFAAKVGKTVGPFSIDYSEIAKRYFALEASLLSGDPPTPYAGGISRDDKRDVEDDTDRVRPAFTRGESESSNGELDS